MLEKPIPHPNADSAPYWAACAEGRLIYQHCTSCDRAQFYPRSICVHCGTVGLEWRESGRRGTVYALTEIHTAGMRSEERRVGKECVGPCRSRGPPDH